MAGDEVLDRVVTVDAGRILQVGAGGILMPLAEAHQGLVRPGIAIVDRNFDDSCLQRRVGAIGRNLKLLKFGEHVVWLNPIRVELDLERGIRRTNLGNAINLGIAHGVGNRDALEEGIERHCLVDLDEDVLVAAI